MNTYFDKPEKADEKDICSQIDIVADSPVMSSLLSSISGLLTVLNEHRQVIALNDAYMNLLGASDSAQLFGLRLGETFHCIHAQEEPAGCGTTKYCSSCGAAIAIASSLTENQSVERMCIVNADTSPIKSDLAFLVRSTPILINNNRFLLIFLQDITIQQQQAALKRTFFHDIRNMLGGLAGASELLLDHESNSEYASIIHTTATRLLKEVEIQQSLFNESHTSYKLEPTQVSAEQIMKELQSFFTNHPAIADKNILFVPLQIPHLLKTDVSLLLRILCNMTTNALEATDAHGQIKVWCEKVALGILFCVWNKMAIEPKTALRIFQRNFSTKSGTGRGIGTYSMKFFGEQILGGKVSFSSSLQDGTTFSILLPDSK